MTDDELVAAYLRRLRRAARALPRARRQELIDEIAEHIADSRAAGPAPGEGGSAALRNALDRLGEPRDIVGAAGGAVRAGGGYSASDHRYRDSADRERILIRERIYSIHHLGHIYPIQDKSVSALEISDELVERGLALSEPAEMKVILDRPVP